MAELKIIIETITKQNEAIIQMCEAMISKKEEDKTNIKMILTSQFSHN